MKYLIHLFKVINPNVGDSVLVYISEDYEDFEHALGHMEEFFKKTGTHIKTSIHYEESRTQAYIEYSFVKEDIRCK